MKKIGQPKITFFVRFIIAYKVMQYQRRFNLTPFKAWMLLTKHSGFEKLMREHFKNKEFPDHWIRNILSSFDVRKTFYKNHIRKIIEQFKNIKIYTPAEFKQYKAKIKANKLSGIASLKSSIKKAR